MRSLLLLLGSLSAGLALAVEPVRQSVPIEYVSPGATGSIGSSSRSQSYDAYGGHALSGQDYGSREAQIQSRSNVRQSGGIRQSIEYPGGIEVQRYPGQSGYEVQRSR